MEWHMTCTENTEILAALKMALPHVARIGATSPIEYERKMRQLDACKAAEKIRAVIASLEARA
jgi:hypothetical protein